MYNHISKDITKKNITKNEFENIEKEFNILLPESFKNFLLEYNGACMSDEYYYKYKYQKIVDQYINLVMFFDFDEIINRLKINLDETGDYDDDDYPKYVEDKMLEIARGSTSDICICYSEQNYGKIYEIDTPHSDEFILINDSFDEFMSCFVLKKDYKNNGFE